MISTLSKFVAELSLRTKWYVTWHLHMISARCVAPDLHTIAPGPLERACWRQFASLWGDCKKSRIAPLNAIIIIIIKYKKGWTRTVLLQKKPVWTGLRQITVLCDLCCAEETTASYTSLLWQFSSNHTVTLQFLLLPGRKRLEASMNISNWCKDYCPPFPPPPPSSL